MQAKIGFHQHGRPFPVPILKPSFEKVKLSWIFLGISLFSSAIIFSVFKFKPPKYALLLVASNHTTFSCDYPLQALWSCSDLSLHCVCGIWSFKWSRSHEDNLELRKFNKLFYNPTLSPIMEFCARVLRNALIKNAMQFWLINVSRATFASSLAILSTCART